MSKLDAIVQNVLGITKTTYVRRQYEVFFKDVKQILCFCFGLGTNLTC